MGGKSSGSSAPQYVPPPPEPQQVDYGAMMMPLFQMMSEQAAQSQQYMMQMMQLQQQQPAYTPQVDPASSFNETDWAAEREKIRQDLIKEREDREGTAADARGRESTIITSPLLGDEDPNTVNKSPLTATA